MVIVDVHAHAGGHDPVFEKDFAIADVIAAHDANGVDATIVQASSPLDLADARRQHDEIATLTRERSGEFFGMALPNPHLPEVDYVGEMRRCVKELGFVGVKLQPLAHAVNPGSRAGRMVFETALELDIPVMIHTGSGIPWGLPSLVAPVARDYPQVRVVLAHSGMNVFALEALELARSYRNVWLETSWTSGHLIKLFIQDLGPERLLFGSDLPYNVSIELFKHRAIGLKDSDLEWVLGRTAIQIFRLNHRILAGTD